MQKDRTVGQVFEADERPALIPYGGSSDGFYAVDVAASHTSLVRYDYNRYSVASHAAGGTIRAYARIISTTATHADNGSDHRRTLAIAG